MDTSFIVTILGDLNSNKVKERKDGLDELTAILKNNADALNNKRLQSVAESLIEALDLEQRRYSDLFLTSNDDIANNSSKIRISEERLSSIAYVLRLFIEKTNSRFKQKTLNFLLAALPELMINVNTNELIPVIAVHLTVSINCLVTSDPFTLKFVASKWIDVVDKQIKFLTKLLTDPNRSNRIITNILIILCSLLSLDTVGIIEIFNLDEVIIKLLKLSTKEDTNTRLLLRIINRLIIKRHCIKLKSTLHLINETIRYMIILNDSKNKDIQSEMIIFDYCASELIGTKHFGTSSVSDSEDDDLSKESVSSLLQEYLLLKLNRYKPKLLLINSVTFKTTKLEKYNIASNQYIQVAEKNDIARWIELKSLVKLLLTYFNVSSNVESYLFSNKRARIVGDCSSYLRSSSDLPHFLINCIEPNNPNQIKALGYHLVFCLLVYYDIDKVSGDVLKTNLLSFLENDQQNDWLLFCFVPLISSMNIDFKELEITKLFKITLPLLKSDHTCKVACILLTHLIRYLPPIVSQNKILDDIYDIYEYSETNGPNLACSESFELWLHLQHYGSNISINSGLDIAKRVTKWLISKWPDFDSVSVDDDSLSILLAWLAGADVNQYYYNILDLRQEDISQEYISSCLNEWEDQKLSRKFLILSILKESKTRKSEITQKVFKIETNREELEQLLHNFSSHVHSQAHINSDDIMKISVMLLLSFDKLYPIQSQHGFIVKSQGILEHIFNSKALMTQRAFNFLFSKLKSLHLYNINSLLPDLFHFDIFGQVLSFYPISKISKSGQELFDDDVFDTSISRLPNTQNVTLNPVTVVFVSLETLHWGESDSSLKPLLDFIKQQHLSMFWECLDTLMNWLSNITRDILLPYKTLLIDITHFLGETLLSGKLGTSSKSIKILSRYLSIFQLYFIQNHVKIIEGDCCDILDWILLRLDDNSFSGSYALLETASLLLQILRKYDVIKYAIQGGKKQLFSLFIKSLNQLPFPLKCLIIENIPSYLKSLSAKNQVILIFELEKLFKIVNPYFEKSVFYIHMLKSISKGSYPLSVLMILRILGIQELSEMESYSISALNSLTDEFKMTSRRDIFDYFKYDILYYFCEQLKYSKSTIEQWNVLLFEFENKSVFVDKYQKEIAAILYSMDINFETCGQFLYNHNAKSDKALIKLAYPLLIPLSLINDNKVDGIEKIISLRQKYVSVDESNILIIVKHLLRFIDFGNIPQVKAAFTSCFSPVGILGEIFDEKHILARYEFPLNIKPHLGFQIFENYKLNETAQFKFLIMWIINDLQQSLTYLEKVRCIREIKFLILIASNVDFLSFLNDVVVHLAPYLVDKELHEELTTIILLFFKSLPKFQEFPVNGLTKVFLFLIDYRQNCGKLSSVLSNCLSTIDIQNVPCNEIWQICIQVLRNEKVTGSVFMYIEPLINLACSWDVLSLFSLLLEKQPSHYNPKCTDLSAEQIIQLIDIKIPEYYVTSEYKLWLAFIIGRLSKFKISPKTIRCDTGKRLLEVSTFPNYTNNIIDALVHYQEDESCSNSATKDFICSTIMSYFITLSSEDTTINLLNKEQTEKYSVDSCRIQEHIFDFICNERIIPVDLDTFLMQKYLSPELTYNAWIKNLINSFITLVQIEYPYFNVLLTLCERSSSFCERIFIELAGLLIYSHPKNSLIWIPKMLNDLCVLINTKDGERKISLLLQLLLLLRYGNVNGNLQYIRLYGKLNLNMLSEICTKNRYYKLSLLLFEEANMIESSSYDYKALQSIYEGLDDKNFLSGLPAAKSLSETWLRINHWKNDQAKTFLFNNAKLDSEYNINNLELLIETSNKGGYNSISKYLSRVSQTNRDAYEWNIKLSEWKLPVPEKIESESTGLYTVIKRISSESKDVRTILSECVEDAIDNRTYFKTEMEWKSLVNELVLFGDLMGIVKSSMHPFFQIKRFYSNNPAVGSFDKFDSCVLILDGRYSFIQALLQRPEIRCLLNNSELNTFPTAVLIENIKLAVSNRSPQYALRNSFVLEKEMRCAEITPDSSLTAYTECTKKYVMADVLWNCGEKRTAVDMLRTVFDNHIEVMENVSLSEVNEEVILTSEDEMRAKLIQWLSELRLDSPSHIYEKYINSAQDVSVNSSYLNVVANFLSTQVHKIMSAGEIESLTQRNQIDTKEATALQNIYENEKLSKQDRTDAWRKMNRMKLQINRDGDKLKSLTKQKETYLLHSLLSFIKILTISNEYDSDVIDKLCELWFENDKTDNLNKTLSNVMAKVPSWKFLPWINQIASKLNYDKSEFQNLLIKVMIQLVMEVPYESVYALASILLYDGPSINEDKNLAQKVMTVKSVLSKVKKLTDRSFYEKHIAYPLEFSTKSVELAMEKYDSKIRKLSLDTLKIGNFWLNELPLRKLPLPTLPFHIRSSDDCKAERPYIIRVEKDIRISSTGISLPKLMSVTLSNGTRHVILFKGSNDDLRQDAIMEQVFHQVNNILTTDKTLSNNMLNIRTYGVIPLGPKAGLIEFVPNVKSLHEILTELHLNDPVTFRQARQIMKAVQSKTSKERLKAYRSITKQVKPQLHNFFFKSFLDPDTWYEAKKRYIKSVATSSIVGHLLGLGDRHLNNLLVDSTTGEVIHIDLGIAFDQGRLLSIPELVPFRLTRDMVDGFGITGVDGLFRAYCEKVYSALRTNSDKLMCVLNILKWDPLYSWVMSPLKKHKHLLEFDDTGEVFTSSGIANLNNRTPSPAPKRNNIFNRTLTDNDENKEAQRALKAVEDKLSAHGLSVEATVQELIQQATDEANLAVIFCGWTPFY